jgi:methyl-accepting chemotaxis protein
LIVPLINNEKVVGAIEIASFVELEQYVIDFVSKLGETIAGAVANVKVNDRTKKLLADSQEQAEALKAQEEEIRQNMEEMQATQEEMERAQRAMKQALITAEEKEKEAQALQEEFEEQKNKIQAEFDAQLAIINATAIVSKTDLRGYITYVNDMFCDVAQYTREELMGQNHNIVRHPDMPAEAFEDVWRTISSGNIWTGQVKNKKKDGSYYWVQATISPVIGENGKPVEYMAVRYLITDMKDQEAQTNQMMEEMKAAEEEIRQNIEEMTATQEQMNTVMNEMNAQNNIINSIAIVSKTDVQGNITYVNDEFCKWSKYTRDEVMGKNHRILRHPDMPAAAFEDLWRTVSSGKVWRGEVKNLAKDGSFYWVDAIIAPVLDEKGKVKEYIAQRFVINEQKEKEAKMQELLDKLEGKNGK